MRTMPANLQPLMADAESRRRYIRKKTVDGVKSIFPIVGKNMTLDVKNVNVKAKSYSSNQQKDALMRGRTLHEPIQGTLVLRDNKTGEVLEEKDKHALIHLPYFTERHTFIVGGNEYDIPNQMRLKPGVYTRERGNGEYEAAFNLSKGRNFRLSMEPDSGRLHMELGTTKVPLYPLLKSLGVPDSDVRRNWGADLKEMNAAAFKGKEEVTLNKVINKIKKRGDRVPPTLEGKREFIADYLNDTAMDANVNQRTLGAPVNKANPLALLAASKKLIDVHKGDATEDDRDSLEFKTIHSVDDFFKERLGVDAKRTIARKLQMKLNQGAGKKLEKIVPSSTFTKSLNSFITSSSLSSLPAQISPVEIIDHASRITSLGEGAIGSERAVPFASRKVHNSSLGVLDPVRTPECVDKHTEVFTEKGWKKWPEVTYSDRLACRIKGQLQFHQPSNITKAKYTGLLYGLKHGKIDYLVTPNHRILSRSKRAGSAWEIKTAEEVHATSRVFDTAHAPFEGNNSITFTLPEVIHPRKLQCKATMPIETWAVFMGWFLSEGSLYINEKHSTYRIELSQCPIAHSDNCVKLYALLRTLPFVWHSYKHKHVTQSKQLAVYLKKFGKRHEKYIPEYLLSASREVRQLLFNALMDGDGSWYKLIDGKKYPYLKYVTVSKKLACGVERLAISLGYVVKTSVVVDNRRGRRNYYELRFLKHRERYAKPKQYYTLQYNDFVYCAEVPGSLLYTRRNGSVPVWTGNSFKAGIDIRSGLAAFKDDAGNLYALMNDARTRKPIHVPTTVLARSTVAFPGQEHRKQLDAVRGIDVVSVPKNEVDYEIPDPTYMFGPSTALVPLLNGMQANRAIMGSKFQTQALPLIDREAPLVQAAAPRKGQSMEREIARLIAPTAPVNGVVDHVDDDYIYIRPEGPKTAAPALRKVPYDTYFPLASKTYLHNDVRVKPGDRVKKDQLLAASNFTKNNTLALGKNLSVGYMAYYGKNSNDAVVISQGASEKLTSEHMYKKVMPKGTDVLLGKAKYTAYFTAQFTGEQLGKLDAEGVVKKGTTLQFGDPVILGLRKAPPTPEAALLGNFHKSLVKPYKDIAVTWDKTVPGYVQDVMNSARQIMVTVRTKEPMKIGDKLANRFGGKGVVSEIVSNERMIRDANDNPVDVLFTSAGVVSRINPAQIVEAAIGKVAHKTGKPVILPQFMPEDNVKMAKRLLKQHGLKDKETVYDPISGKKIDNIFVGRSYINKLFKSTDTNYAARGVSDYDVNLQPTRGGDEGAKGVGRMEINALLAHNARNVLKENLTSKSEKSDEFWRAYEFGLPPPPPKAPFVADKLVSMLQGAGINVDKSGSQVSLGPLTDRDVTKLSSGSLSIPSLEKSKSFMVSARNMKPEKGGLFDPALTGGLTGTRWSHMVLNEPVVNPVFEEPVRRLLGMTKKQLRETVGQIGGKGVRDKLNRIDLTKKEKELRALVKTKRGADLDNAIKQLKYIQALKRTGNKRAGTAYTLSKVPVVPPVFRPILPSQRGNELQVSDINYLYRDVGLASEALKGVAATGLPEATAGARLHLQDATNALFGTARPTSPQLQGREAKGFVEQITGSGSPKSGFLHKKILKRQQDLSGRATATPDNTLNMDQIGIPEDMVWKTYSKFIMKGLINQGYKAAVAAEMIEEQHPTAKAILQAEIQKRPVFVNRAPSLHKHNFVAAYPVPVVGKSLRVNPFMEQGQNLDYDGDTMQIHVPVGDKAVTEAQNLTLSKLLFSDKNRDDLMVFPQHEAILGAYLGTAKKVGKTKRFKSKAEAMTAYRSGDITMNTPVEIKP